MTNDLAQETNGPDGQAHLPYKKMSAAITAALHLNRIPASRQKRWLINLLGVSTPTANRMRLGKSNLADCELLKLASACKCELKLKLYGPGDVKKVVNIDLNNSEADRPYKSLALAVANQLESAGLKPLEIAQILKCSAPSARRKLNGKSPFQDDELAAIFATVGINEFTFEYAATDQESPTDTAKEVSGGLTTGIEPEPAPPSSGLIDESFTSDFPDQLFSWFVKEIDIAMLEHSYSGGRVPRYRLENLQFMARQLAEDKGIKRRKISPVAAGLLHLLNHPDSSRPV